MAARNASVGETISFSEPPRKVVVKEPCASSDGHHYCATHGEGFPNNLSVNSHAAEPGQHVLVWNCIEHGPERP